MTKSRRPPVRPTPPAGPARRAVEPAPHAGGGEDAFFRHLVAGMRNGVLALTRDFKLALINEEAYRIFGLTRQAGDLGRPIAEVLQEHPEVVRVLTSTFDVNLLSAVI